MEGIVRLKKALFGLRLAPLAWHERLRNFLLACGFVISDSNFCLFILRRGNEEIFVCVYVDSFLLASYSTKLMHEVKDKFSSEFKMKDLGRLERLLKLEAKWEADGGMVLCQEKFAPAVVVKFGSLIKQEYDTSMPVSALEPVVNAVEITAEVYRSAVGSLMYLIVCTRPDLAYSVAVLARHVASPKPADMVLSSRVLGYLKRTASLGIYFGRDGGDTLVDYADAD